LAGANIENNNGLEAQGVQPYSVDENNARRLWSLSEEMTGIAFEVI
jgi:hypothetical protein